LSNSIPPILEATEVTVIDESWFKILAGKKREIRSDPVSRKSRPLIATFGSALLKPNTKTWKETFKLGAELAKKGAVVINGGYAGVMEAAAAGAASVSGTTVGITCTDLPERAANPFIQNEWRLDRWDQRLIALVWLADGYAILPGSSGTLVELSMVIETQLKGFIPMRPIVCLGNFWRPVARRIVSDADFVKFTDNTVEAASWLVR
jgi:uncharacterized protein (TIGR00725 family)